MIRREALLGIGSGVALSAMAVNTFSAAPAPLMEDPHKHGDDKPKPSALIHAARTAGDCAVECDECYTHCLKMVYDGKQEHVASTAACLDCADICSTASRIMARKGAMTNIIRDACVQACTACALECEKYPDHPKMKECAAVCRRCIEACKAIKD